MGIEPLSDAELAASLARKYRQMRELRERYERDATDKPAGAIRQLAKRFPGALRELDRLSLPLLRERLDTLEGAMQGLTPLPDWARWFAEYHRWMRVALFVRSQEFAANTADSHMADTEEPADHADDQAVRRLAEALTETDRLRILSPPDGRMNRWVLERIGRQFQQHPADIEAALFGSTCS